jgi:serine phosphatase RsbU (regulator of sigma subunit)
VTELTLDLRRPPTPSNGSARSTDDGSETVVPSVRRPRWPVLAVSSVGMLATALLTWSAWVAHDHNETRLVRRQTQEAAVTLANGLPAVQTPLVAAAELARATDGDPETFRRYFGAQVGDDARFDHASLWAADPSATEPLVVIGTPPALPPGERTEAALERAIASPTLILISLLDLPEPRIAYLYSPSDGGDYVVYAESLLPAARTAQVRTGEAFDGLDFAVYFGDSESTDDVVIASTDDLPLDGRRASAPVLFGDSRFTLVMRADSSLGGPLMAALPWIIAAVGSLLTLAGATTTRRLVQRRVEAESLSRQNAVLYDRQRGIAQTLQRNLLPDQLPELDHGEVAARHEAGEQGAEIGGDWYEVLALDDARLLLIVGDVSGRGLPAAATMAALRFSARAYALEGHSPADILVRLSTLLDVARDGHFATVLCAEIDVRLGTIRVASAGHPSPVLAHDGHAELVPLRPGLPIGLGASSGYDTVVLEAGPAATFVAFTDGLFERRGEPVDVGLERVRRIVAQNHDAPLGCVLDRLTTELLTGSEDDTAIVGVRWQRPTP